MPSEELERFFGGLNLLADAKPEHVKQIDEQVRQNFWRLDPVIRDKAISFMQLQVPRASRSSEARKLQENERLTAELLFEARDGNLVWNYLGALIGDGRVEKLLSSFITKDPSKFSFQTLQDICAKPTDGMAAAISSLLHRQPGETEKDIDGKRQCLEELKRTAYEARLSKYTKRTGPVLGASFESEIAAFRAAANQNAISPKIVSAIEEAEQYLKQPKTTFSFKIAMDLIRTAYEAVIRHCAHDGSQTGGRLLTAMNKEKILSDHESKLGTALFSFVSERGSHALDSEETEARLSFFMVLEFSQFLLGKVKANE